MANIVPVSTWPEGSRSGSAIREQPAKGRDAGRQGARDGEKSAPARTATQPPARPLRPDPRGPAEQREQSGGGKGPEGACISLNRSLPVLPLRPGSLPPAGSQGQPHAPSRGLEGGPPPRAKCRLLPTFPTPSILRRQPPASIPNTSPPQGSEISKARPLFLTSFDPYRREEHTPDSPQAHRGILPRPQSPQRPPNSTSPDWPRISKASPLFSLLWLPHGTPKPKLEQENPGYLLLLPGRSPSPPSPTTNQPP